MQQVEIRVKGYIDEHWSAWFSDLEITHTDRDETILRGAVADQSAVYGLLGQVAGLRVGTGVSDPFGDRESRGMGTIRRI